jgi:hypothetical protein
MATLDDKLFDQAVCVHGMRAGQVQNIGSVREAAEWLLYEWPSDIDTAKARAARKACLEVLKGESEAATARQAFRAAAAEAGVLIGDVDRVPKPGKVVKHRR